METGWPSVIVVDTNIICYRCMASPYANAADAAWRRDPSWIVPTLWRSEFRNALAGALRQHSLTVEAAMEIASLAEAMLAGNEFTISTSAVLQLVQLHLVRLMTVNLLRLPKNSGSGWSRSIA